MIDYFTLLAEPRRPWLDPDFLKRKFLTLAAGLHPDRFHNADELEKAGASRRYAELNAAYHCLAAPKSRLRHLLELELGAKPKDIQQIPPLIADMFAEVATACRKADGFLLEKSRAVSPLGQVQIFERAQEWVDRLNLLQRKLNDWGENLTGGLKSLDETWNAGNAASRAEILPKLEELYRLFGYLNRWSGQIQERMVQLMF
jgi:curved DNA-binding protein CbpA